jgi:hypothetical protein
VACYGDQPFAVTLLPDQGSDQAEEKPEQLGVEGLPAIRFLRLF